MSENKKIGIAIGSLIYGIGALAISWIPFYCYFSLFLGFCAVFSAIIAICKGKLKPMAIVALIMGIISLAIACMTIYTELLAIDAIIDDTKSSIEDVTGDNTKEILKNNVKITFGTFIVDKKNFIRETKLPVNVKNKCDDKKSFIVSIEALDKDGNRIITDTLFIDNLGAGQTQRLDAFTYVSDESIKELKTAKFNVYNVSMY